MLNILSSVSYFPINNFFPFRLRLNLRAFKTFLFLLSGLLLISSLALYVFQVNSVVQKTYLLRNYEEEQSILSEENKKLEMSVSHANALENIEAAIKDLNYKEIGEVEYIQVLEPQVVAK